MTANRTTKKTTGRRKAAPDTSTKKKSAAPSPSRTTKTSTTTASRSAAKTAPPPPAASVAAAQKVLRAVERREATLHTLSVSSVLATGDGTQERPWSVLRVADEYDILRASSQRPTAQRQVSDERGQFDVHTLEDGGEVWFRLLWLAPSAAAQEDEIADDPQS